MRLNRLLASRIGVSRRKADELIFGGRVKVNGVLRTDPGCQAEETDKVEYQGVETQAPVLGYFALNKPKGVTSTLADRHAEKTILDLLPPKLKYLKPAGRLDRETHGLILLSNDGDFLHTLMHPRHTIEKEYWVEVAGFFTPEMQEQMEQGVPLEDGMTAPARVQTLAKEKGKTRVSIIIHEGKKRQVRRMCAYFDLPVLDLQRVRVGEILLGDLPLGEVRALTSAEIKSITQIHA